MNRQLKRKFNEYNRKYFDGRLPKDTAVDWHYELKNGAKGACHVHPLTRCDQIPKSYNGGKCNGRHLILINTSLWDDIEQSYSTLLHEMVHLDAVNGNIDLCKHHGEEFQAGMLRLATLGALAKLW